ncbi:MAG TPA: hypothetical protein PLU30_15950 [Verrucomicrobiae bacterium]|nr:hypothetical protein [Verrucomicrobiae bacterium]
MRPIEIAKDKMRIPQLWEMLGLSGKPGNPCHSPFRKDRNPSFSVYDDGRRFNDFGNPEHRGDAVDFLRIARGLSPADAVKEFIRLVGCESSPQMPAARPTLAPGARDVGREAPTPPPRPMSSADAAWWADGIRRLKDDSALKRQIAEWRGWPVGLVATLADDGLMGVVFSGKVPNVAFPVVAPAKPRGPIQTGLHLRPLPPPDGWRFHPGGGVVRALPFVLGEFRTARLLVICEGLWDAITFAHAAGWFGHDASWPDWACALGIRGAQGVRPFLEAHGPCWPDPPPNVLLMPDADAAGRTWFEAGSNGREPFADQLAARARKVAVVTCGGAKDFNEAFKARPISPADIGAMMLANGLTDERGNIL